MSKWNPFEKQILNADPDEFAGSDDAGYGVPRDAYSQPDVPPQDADVSSLSGDISGGETPSAGPDNMPGGETPSAGPDEIAGREISSAGPDDMAGGEISSAGPDDMAGGEISSAGPDDIPGGEMPSAGPDDMTGPDDAFRREAGMTEGEISASGPAEWTDPDSIASGNDGTSTDYTADSAPGWGSSYAGETAGQTPQDPSGPSGPSGPDGPGFGPGHDFEDDEPKFDTQTGERLDKPKKKFPSMILTVAVSMLAVGLFVYSVKPGALPSGGNTETKEPTETETALAIASSESETETENGELAGTGVRTEEAAQTESAEQTETEMSAAAARGKAEREEALQTETERAAETETETEKEPGLMAEGPRFSTDGVTVSTSGDISDLVEEVMPEVVSVTATSLQTVWDFLYGTPELLQTDAGSGIIVGRDDECLYVVTDAAIVKDVQDVTVGFSVRKDISRDLEEKDTVASAQVTGISDDGMLAVVRVPLDGINETVLAQTRTAVLGDSDMIRVGERVIAIGNAMGRGLSVTQGIVSAVDRFMRRGAAVHNFIQTDASINYGNYGGALLNEAGEVIGINAGNVADDTSEGMGFAFPVNYVREAVSGLIPEEAYLSGSDDADGPETEAAEDSEADMTKNPETETAEDSETETAEDSETETAENQEAETEAVQPEEKKEEKEILTLAIAQEESETSKAAQDQTDEKQAEESQTEESQTEERQTEEGQAKEEQAEERQTEEGLAEEEQTEEGQDEAVPGASSQGQLGVQVGEFSKEDQIIYRIPAGVVVADVVAGSGAQAAGLRSGDLITKINDTKVDDVSQLKGELSGLKVSDKVKVSFIRPDQDGVYEEGNETSVTVTLQ